MNNTEKQGKTKTPKTKKSLKSTKRTKQNTLTHKKHKKKTGKAWRHTRKKIGTGLRNEKISRSEIRYVGK